MIFRIYKKEDIMNYHKRYKIIVSNENKKKNLQRYLNIK